MYVIQWIVLILVIISFPIRPISLWQSGGYQNGELYIANWFNVINNKYVIAYDACYLCLNWWLWKPQL